MPWYQVPALLVAGLLSISLTSTFGIAYAADPSQLAQLRETKSCEFCDLSGANLSGADLLGADLLGANLTRADLTRANLTRAKLTGTNLSEAHLFDANLTKAKLSEADLSYANLSGAILSEAELSLATLTLAELSGATLTGAILTRAKLSQAGLSYANLIGANLTEADLSKAILTRANLTKADLSKAILTRANLTWVDLNGAILTGANLTGANLTGANLTRADLSRTDLTEAILDGTNLTRADLTRADLTRATLYGANLTDINLAWTILTRAVLSGTNLTGANLFETDLTEANLSEATLVDARFEAARVPPGRSFMAAKGLETLWWRGSPNGMILLRDALKNAGMREQERKVTYAQLESQRINTEGLEGKLQYVLFEMTSDWGMSPARPLWIMLSLIPVFALVYILPLWRPSPETAVWRVWDKDRARKDQGQDDPEQLTVRGYRLPVYAMFFSVLSAFQIGWRELNVGNWITRLSPYEFALKGTGWVRTIAGVQSLISVYLLALAVLTYFGRPFE